MPRNVATTVATPRFNRRLGLVDRLDAEFAATGAADTVRDHKQLYGKTSRLVLSPEVKSFDISGEPQAVRTLYGDSQFGKGCLLARRLVESGVTFVEVRHGNWDTHFDIFAKTKELIGQVDPGVGGLILDLKQRGLLEKTLVVWAGEFGRTPYAQSGDGRDHNHKGYSIWMAGGGVKGGLTYGATDDTGYKAVVNPMHIHDWHATILHLLGLDHRKLTYSYGGRSFRLTNVSGEVARGVLA